MVRVEIKCNGNELVNCDIKSMEENKMENEILTNQEMYEKMKQQYDEADKMIENLKEYYRVLGKTPAEFEDILKQHEKHAEDLKHFKAQVDKAAELERIKEVDDFLTRHFDNTNSEPEEDDEDVWSDDEFPEDYDEEEYDETTHEELTKKKLIKTAGIITGAAALIALIVKAVKKHR